MATNVQMNALKAVVPAAQTTARIWKVPASVTLAQWTLESAWGTSQLARQALNFFGVKAVQGEDYMEFSAREVVRGRSVMEMAEFAKYGTAIESFAAHAYLIAGLSRYAPCMAHADDAFAFAMELGPCGYSTSPTYGQGLCDLIREHNLTQYDAAPTPGTPVAVVAAA